MSRKRRGLLFIIVPVLSFIASIILFSNIIYRRVRSNDLERFSIKIKKHRLPNLGVNDYENENCYKPERISTGLAKLVKQLDSASCKRTILNVACLMEKNRLYPQFIQKECQKDAKPASVKHIHMASIGFLILVHGRQVRQIKRLLLNIFRPEHTYFIYVASCSNYTFNQLTQEIDGLSKNIFIKQHKAIPCNSYDDFDLTMAALKEFLIKPIHWKWDYLIKLNEKDFPILPIDDISRFLAITVGTNYLDIRNYYQSTIPIKVKCNGRVHSIGETEVPKGITVQYGPFWFILTKEFVKYWLNSNDILNESILKWSQATGAPGEYYLQTLIANSVFCPTVENHSLFIRKTMPSNSSVVTNFDDKDFFHLLPENNLVKLHFFAENFDPTLNQQIIENIESLIQLEPNEYSIPNGLKNFWYTLWNWTEGPLMGVEKSFVTLTSSLIFDRLRRCPSKDSNSFTPLTITTLRRFDTYEGFLMNFAIKCVGVRVILESFIQSVDIQQIVSFTEGFKADKELLSLKVVVSTSNSELRKDVSIYGNKDKLKLITHWVIGDENIMVNVVFMDPSGHVQALQKLNISKFDTKVEVSPDLPEYLEAGLWAVQIVKDLKIIGETEFIILPSDFSFDAEYTLDNMKQDFQRYKTLFSTFHKVKRVCVLAKSREEISSCQCAKPDMPDCEETDWSSYSPDTKSDITRIRDNYIGLL